MIFFAIVCFFAGVILTLCFMHLAHQNEIQDLQRYARSELSVQTLEAFQHGYMRGMRDEMKNQKNNIDIKTALIPAVA
jgi:hypothetical protein